MKIHNVKNDKLVSMKLPKYSSMYTYRSMHIVEVCTFIQVFKYGIIQVFKHLFN